MKIILTMAGLGSRFKKAGFREEKHEIKFMGKTLFEWALNSLVNFREYEFIFITRNFKNIKNFIQNIANKLEIFNLNIKIINYSTRGQAETALLAKQFFKDDDSLFIYNNDTHVDSEYLKPEFIKGNGWIPVFSAPGGRWSFVEVNNEGFAVRTTEKIRISNHCSIGLYYFDSFKKFENLVKDLTIKVQNEDLEYSSKEWYIAPLYNDFIKKGNKVYIHQIPYKNVLVLGTPDDLAIAEKRMKS